ncbi:hypothetical protein PMAYCL1PPCAC_08306, partial [Pristionchus mayeri]
SSPMLCNSHFSPSSFIHADNRVILRGDAIPFFEDSPMNAGMEDILGPTVDSSNETKQEPKEIKVETVDEFIDFNQEEPTSDLYAYHIGNSRPLNQCTPRDHCDGLSKAK